MAEGGAVATYTLQTYLLIIFAVNLYFLSCCMCCHSQFLWRDLKDKGSEELDGYEIPTYGKAL